MSECEELLEKVEQWRYSYQFLVAAGDVPGLIDMVRALAFLLERQRQREVRDAEG
jgi:hypothetical protein